jgi:hypothetical protein
MQRFCKIYRIGMGDDVDSSLKNAHEKLESLKEGGSWDFIIYRDNALVIRNGSIEYCYMGATLIENL